MNKKTAKMYQRLCKLYDAAEKLTCKLDKEVQKICEFEVSTTYCAGDGILLMDLATADVGSFICLQNKNKKNKLNRHEFKRKTF